MYTNEQKRDAARREVKQREHVYKRLVASGAMSQEQADYQIKIMTEIADDYEALAQKERLV